MVISICIDFFALIIRLSIVKLLVNYSIIRYIKEVIIPVFEMTLLSIILPLILFFVLKQSIFRLCIIIGINLFSGFIWMYLIGLNKAERKNVKFLIKNIVIGKQLM
jgi:hypothetical protein